MSSENASQNTFFFNIRFCLMSLLNVKHKFIWRVLLRYNTRHHGYTFVGTMYFVVMGRQPVVIINYVRYCCCGIALAFDALYNEKISFSYFAIVKYTRNSMQTVSLNKHLITRLPMTLLFLFLVMVHVGTYTHLSNTRVFVRFDKNKVFYDI